MQIKVMTNILERNDQVAAALQERFKKAGILVINLLGSPGCGKTSLLEKTIKALKETLSIAVIEGDLFTAKDAERIEEHGVPVVQINTGGGCHLDANMIHDVLDCLDLGVLDMIVIENVGNLVCPAEFNIGEDCKVTVLSITEGDDKPLKYPLIFKQASAVILNKVDLLPYTNFDLKAAEKDITAIHPGVTLLPVSCQTGEGLEVWFNWLIKQVQIKKGKESK
ncbi:MULTISPECIES: hydrogenase nickel incorporation protein HypB [Pelosinus]|uniref:Hydrogenase accessory protein HypB n=1 Tax=Pelosinus fermentans B4 TaxID=1149862 RepID=I9LAU6_9FIRM|nr:MULTISPECIES: hydrogenase nickel incorporation protein HypB [Pelosinus]EIW17426.1 hydrogenase accessory protein HypB [Pelosinus fermentans B4]EIW23485.1 hydrogenase accessory protein HypB [Pelosinus fermentans A11]OAM96584.1 hydrogenase accessory protein HypB [Pelosinus fermentans DSM 17108]SDR41600.1 Hydrogenase nickel incorporation protein HypB [Pelosinus fermentans]